MTAGRSERPRTPLLHRGCWSALAIGIAVLDQWSKRQMQAWLSGIDNQLYEVTFFMNLRSVGNSGAAFGLLADSGDLAQRFLAGYSVVFCVVIFGYLMVYRNLKPLYGLIAALLLGGGIGNGIDRVSTGIVYDFVDLHLGGWHWPAFNVADMAISASMVLIIVLLFADARSEKPAAAKENS